MKNIFLVTISAFVLMLTFVACNSDSDVDEPQLQESKILTIVCSTDDGSDTRSVLSEKDWKVYWESGDKISAVFNNGGNSENNEFILKDGAGTRVATFTGEQPSAFNKVAFVFPYQYQIQFHSPDSWGTTDVYTQHVMLPNAQTATVNSYDTNAMIQMSKNMSKTEIDPTEVKNVDFYNFGGMLQLKPTYDCTSIMVEALGGETLSGMMKSHFYEGETYPAAEPENSMGSSITTLCGKISKGKYYVCTLPFDAKNGLRITYRNGDKAFYDVITKNEVKLERGHIKGVPEPIGEAPASTELVDLGLSIKWSSVNIGATAPTEKGYNYAWGELGTKQAFLETNYLYSITSLTYEQLTDENTDIRILKPTYDIASLLSGGAMRMPTKAEWEELINNCTWTIDGNGYKVTSKTNGNFIYLPYTTSTYGNYWTSTLNTSTGQSSDYGRAYNVMINSTEHEVISNGNLRSSGYAIRPVGK